MILVGVCHYCVRYYFCLVPISLSNIWLVVCGARGLLSRSCQRANSGSAAAAELAYLPVVIWSSEGGITVVSVCLACVATSAESRCPAASPAPSPRALTTPGFTNNGTTMTCVPCVILLTHINTLKMRI